MRWIVRIIAILIVLVVGVVGLVFLLPADKIGDLASAQLEKATGRKLTLSGRFSPTIYPVLGVKTGPLTISNADWAVEKYMVSAEGASVGVGLVALLGGGLEVQKLVLSAPVIHLERNKDGVANWDLSGGAQASDAQSSDGTSGAGGFTLNKGSIQDGLVTYKDATSGQDIKISDINADFSLPKSAATALNGTAVWDGNKAKVDLSIADLQKLLGGDVSNLAGSLSIGSLVASLDGQVKVAPNAAPLINGQYDIKMPDLKALSALTGANLPDMIVGAKAITSTGTLMASDAGLSLVGKGAVTMNGLPIEVNTEITGPENWAETLRVELAMDIIGRDAFAFSWAGLVNGKTQNADGTISFTASDLPKMLKAVDQEIGFPKGTGNTASVKGTVRVRNGKNTLSKATFSLDQNSFRGDVELAFDRKPFIAANLTAGDLDLSAFASDELGAGTGGSDSSSNNGWSKEPIRISGLDAINADINLKANSVDLGVSKLDKTDVNARLRDGSLYLTLRDVRAYQGALSGKVSFRAGDVVSFKSDIKANGVQLEPLLGRLLDLHRLTGAGNTTLNMSGTGGSLYQIMHSLSGEGTLQIDKGSFKGIDLAGMMRNLQKAFGGFEGATEFTSLTGTFTTKDGVLQNVDMSLISPLFKAEGKGQINVGEQSMSYTVTPTSLAKDANFSVPVDITGPWNNLKFRPDLGSLIDLLSNGKLEENKAALKAKEDDAKAKAEAKLRKELDIVEDENSQDVDLEDAAKKKLEDKLKDELGGALKNLFD
jgi:AsmA protein